MPDHAATNAEPFASCKPRSTPMRPPSPLLPPSTRCTQGVEQETASPWHRQAAFGPFAFYDVAGRESVPPGGASIMNKAEAHMVREEVWVVGGGASAHVG